MRSKQLGYLGIGNRRSLNVVQRPFSPSDLFATGEQGVWYDPSDLSTMFQDSAGTTPVTAVEQPVGLLLDKSKGLVLGPELVTNGDFSNGTTGWTAAGLTAAVVDGEAAITRSGTGQWFSQGVTTVAGKSYKITFNYRNGTQSGGFYVGTSGGNSSLLSAIALTSGPTATMSAVFVASGTSSHINFYVVNTGTFYVDNISIREIAGNHASQSTSASRPTLSARYNLLTYSEQFDDAAWTKINTTVTQNADTAPDGTATAESVINTATSGVEHYIEQVVSTATNSTYTASVFVKPTGAIPYFGVSAVTVGSTFTVSTAIFVNTGGVVTLQSINGLISSATISAAANGYYRLTIVYTLNGAVTSHRLRINTITTNVSTLANGDGTSGLYLWGAQLIVTNDLTSNAYQRIAAATDYDSDATKFPKYLRFDGTDDSLATSSIDFSGTNKLSIFSALRRLSDSAQGMVLELSATTASNNGTFSLETPSTASGSDFQFISKGTVANTINADDYPNPYSAIITAQSAISTPLSNIRINGLEVDSDAGTQGTGNFGNFPLYVGRRNNASLPFNGRLYGMIVRGAETPEYLVEITESWLFGKSGITLDTTPDYTFVTLSNGDFVVDAYGNNVFIEVS